MRVKTIDIKGLEWFDKVNGNSYFATEIIVNYGMKTEKVFKCPFQYGYGDSYLHAAKVLLIKEKIFQGDTSSGIWTICQKCKYYFKNKQTGKLPTKRAKQFARDTEVANSNKIEIVVTKPVASTAIGTVYPKNMLKIL